TKRAASSKQDRPVISQAVPEALSSVTTDKPTSPALDHRTPLSSTNPLAASVKHHSVSSHKRASRSQFRMPYVRRHNDGSGITTALPDAPLHRLRGRHGAGAELHVQRLERQFWQCGYIVRC